MMKNNKNQCTNVSTESYTGKEQSPKRFGLSAEGFDINYEKEGFDKLIWVVQFKNNRKVWVRKNNIITITHEEPVIPDNKTHKIIDNPIDNPINNDDIISDKKDKDIENIEDTNKKDKEDNDTSKTDKKKTDYNIFLKYYLNKLKEEEENKLLAHKVIFQMAIQEWARLKKNPTELKSLIETIKNK
jgi:hypothetical protein